jgi:hypothetical protein
MTQTAPASSFPDPKACPKAEDDTSEASPEDYAALAEKMGMSQTCVQEARNKRADMQTSTSAVVVSIIGGGAATANTNESSHDLGMTTSGCGKMSLTAETINKIKKTMTCSMNSTISEQSAEVNDSSSLQIITVAPSDTKVANINATIQRMHEKTSDAVIAAAMIPMPVIDPGYDARSAEVIMMLYKSKFEMMTQNITRLEDSVALYIETNRTSADALGINATQRIDSTLDVKSTQNASEDVKKMMIEDMKSIASATAIDKVSTTVGIGSLPPNEKKMIIKNVNDEIDKQKTDIDETITKNSMSANANKEIILRVEGSIRGGEIAQAIKSQVSLVIEQVTKKSLEIGNTVATDFISTTKTDTHTENMNDGTDLIVKANAEDRAAMAEQMYQKNKDSIEATGAAVGAAAKGIGDGVGSAAKGIGEGAGAALGGMMMLAMFPLIIVGVLVIGGLFVLPKLAPKLAAMSGMSPTMIKYAGMALFALIVGLIIIFKIVPIFTKKDSRISYNKVNQRAPVQAIHSRTNKQSLTPYGKSLYYKGDRTARKIPSYTKINNSMNYKVPIARKFVNKYNPINDVTNVLGNHFPTMHIQNKVEEKPVMYTRTSRV